MKPGSYVTLRNAKIDMFRGSMRLAVNQVGAGAECRCFHVVGGAIAALLQLLWLRCQHSCGCISSAVSQLVGWGYRSCCLLLPPLLVRLVSH